MDTSPTTLFDSYEQDFQHLLQGVRDKLEGDGKGQRGGLSHPFTFYLHLLIEISNRAAKGRSTASRDRAR